MCYYSHHGCICYYSHHGWNSFEAIAEIYNESMRDSHNYNYINSIDFSRSYPISQFEGYSHHNIVVVYMYNRECVSTCRV